MRTHARWMTLWLTICAWALASCGSGDFDPQSVVSSVRMFGVRADKPFAKPGETVELEVLTTDARPAAARTRTLRNVWVPVVCINPPRDLYYLCFAQGAGGARLVAPFSGAAGSGAPGGAAASLASIPTDTDLSSVLPSGPRFRFQMPEDAIVERPGSAAYGLALVFNIACAGQVRFGVRAGDNPQQLPLRCTDEQGNALPPEDYVIGINRIYSYADRDNTNPVVERVTFEGTAVNLSEGIVVGKCVADKREDCPPVKIDVVVSDASWESNPATGAAEGQREQIWVAYYSDLGEFKNDARLLFDARKGRVSESAVEYRAPSSPGVGTIWAIVHDNRVGAAFVSFPVLVR
jgi:hypothetical protein